MHANLTSSQITLGCLPPWFALDTVETPLQCLGMVLHATAMPWNHDDHSIHFKLNKKKVT